MEDKSAVEEQLKQFFSEMRQWELGCARRDRSAKAEEITYDEARRRSLEELTHLFARFVVQQDGPRRSQHGLRYSRPPEYDPDGENILTIEFSSDGIARVLTQQISNGRGIQCVYRLKKLADRWRILDSRMRVDRDGNEVSWDL